MIVNRFQQLPNECVLLAGKKKVQGFTCAVQMLLVALSLRMCCSLVCKASRNTSFPAASLKWKYAHNMHI